MNHCILLIFALTVCRVSANKYCSLESNGEPKYFICARNEYCCHFGCCVHLAFQFYQLWYYWLLLIFMFMLCSGGSWWYKFCRHNENSSYPSLPPTFENRQSRQQIVDSRRNRSIDRNTADNSFYFQRIWKANGMGPPPNYYTASVVRYHSASELETRRQQQECPYYQLYGPPPSYESVVRIPENGYGQPSCTLVPATTSASAQSAGQQICQQQQHQQNILTQSSTNYLNDNLTGISYSNQLSNDNSHHVAHLVGQQQQQQQNPIPSTSVQVDFVNVPVHLNEHKQQHQTTLSSSTTLTTVAGTSTAAATASTSDGSTSPLQFRATNSKLDCGPSTGTSSTGVSSSILSLTTTSTVTSTKTTGTTTSPVLEIKDDLVNDRRNLEDQV